MKTIFQEASSLGKAVQKAWEDAGNPENFSVKVLNVGESGFWGFGGTPFTISISTVNAFSEQIAKNKAQVNESPNKKAETFCSFGASKEDSNKKETKKPNSKFSRNSKESSRPKLNRDEKPVLQTKKTFSTEESFQDLPADSWTEQTASKAVELFQDAIKLLDIEIEKIDQNIAENILTIKIFFSPNYSADSCDKTIFINIAPLIVQMAKRSVGESLRGLRLVIEVAE